MHTQQNALLRKLHEERGNCFLYGCVTVVVLAILGGLISFLVFRSFARQVREKYTEPTAAALPTADLPAAETEALIARVDEYVKRLRADEQLGTLVLTQNEVNALLQNHPDLKEDFGSIVYLTLGDDNVTGQMSIPLDWLPLMSGRFFNGTATFDVEVKRGRAEVYLTGATVKGEVVPEQYIVGVRSENLATDWQREHKDARTLLEKIESVKIESGTVIITPMNLIPLTPVVPSAAETPTAEEPAASPPAESAPPPAN